MDKMQVEEMRDFFSQEITYEKISAILQAIYSCIRGYSVKSVKRFCQKMEFVPGSFNIIWEQSFLKQLQRFKRTSTKFTFSSN